MDFTVLYYTGIVIVAGLLFSKLVKLIKLPNVTGYLLAGIVIGPQLLGLLPKGSFSDLDLVKNVALAFIAFSIGSELKISYFKRVGAKPIIIAFFEASFGVLMVLGLILAYFAITGQFTTEHVQFSIVLAAIAAATAPAATLMVIRQYKAKGPVTETLMSVVALDDSVAVLLFGICIAIANAIGGTAQVSTFMQILTPIIEIVVSLGAGLIVGAIVVLATKWFTGRGNRISVVVGAVFLTMVLASKLSDWMGMDISWILAAMGAGSVFANTSEKSEEINGLVYFFTPPIFIMFFVSSGAELDFKSLLTVGALGLIYLFGRIGGKFTGAYVGAKVSKAGDSVAKHLGLCLIPQAGVAIGLASSVKYIVGDAMGTKINAIILASTVIYALSGAIVTRFSLHRAGELQVR